MNDDLYALKQNFLEAWPIERLEIMPLMEYTNLDKNSFCYEVEHVTRDLGSIVGGSSYKFGIYKRNSKSEVKEESNRTTDGEYAWFKKYGENSKEEAFETIKSIIIKIALAAQRNDLSLINDIDLGYGYKWKIAFLYGDFHSLNIFKEKVLKTIGNHLDLPIQNMNNASDYHRAILEQKKPAQDYFNYTGELWEIATMEIEGVKKEFSDWLKGNENSNKVNSYLRAIDILNEILDDDLYLEENMVNLQTLYDDLILDQKNKNSKYYYDKAPSYGNNGFYSASVKALKTFLENNGNGINLSKNHIYKISLGQDFFSMEDFDRFMEKGYVAMHEKTSGKGRGAGSQYLLFKNELKEGDYIYVCYSNEKMGYLGRIASAVLDDGPEFRASKDDGWKYREFNTIAKPIKLEKYNSISKWWTPNNNSTFDQIPKNEYDLANQLILEPYYGLNIRTTRAAHLKNETMSKAKYNKALNTILYGPPGTGKTYHTILEAAKIITQNESISYKEALDVFNEELGNHIEFITFHQNYSYEDFIQGLRPDTEISGQLSFYKKDGVFKRIADKALKNLNDFRNPAAAKKEFDIVFSEFIKPLVEEEKQDIEVMMKQTSYFITEVGEKSIEFRKNQGESKHTLSIATLNKMYDKGKNEIISGGLQPYYNPILEVLLEKGKSNVLPVQEQNYVIIIDEINRANISRVFGELITLIEKDKRSHGEIPLTSTLPSGDSFIVPSNLYIIGTMNTADKSIALLDIALRRRFQFIPMYPDSRSTEDKIVYDPEIMESINKEIIDRKGHDFTIGHSYFMGDDYELKDTIDNKVLPLLLEYFMNDYDEVKKILAAANLTVDGWPLQLVEND
jgi:5-methylcytosine-specific restriction protein B